MTGGTRGVAVALLALVLLLAAGCDPVQEEQPADVGTSEASAADYVAWGIRAEQQGERGMARDHFRIALDRDPSSVEARHGLARLHMTADEYEAAWTLLKEIREIDSAYFRDLIADAAVMTYRWALEAEADGLDDVAREIYILTWDLTSEVGFRHPEAADLHWKMASFYWPSEARADWSRALNHLHLASQARPTWPEPLVAIAEVAMAVDRPADSLWALNRARSLSARSLDALEEENRRTLATLYLIRAQELFENVEIRFGGIYSGTRREDPAEYLEAAARLMPDSLPLHYWLARIRLSASEVRGASSHVNRAMALLEGEPADYPEELEQWLEVYLPALNWLHELVSRGPVHPPVSISNSLTIAQAPLVRPRAVWAPAGHRLAYATWSGVFVATPHHQAESLLQRMHEFHPHGPLAWADDGAIYVSLLRTPQEEEGADEDEILEIPAASRLVIVDLETRQAQLVRDLPGGWMTGDLAVHRFTGRIALTLVPFPDEDEGSRHDGYVLIVLGPDGAEVISTHRQGIPGDLSWRPDGEAVLVTDRPFPHFAPTTREISVADGTVVNWPGAGAPHPVQPLYAHGLIRTPWTELRVGASTDADSSGVLTYLPLTLDDVPAWSPDGRFIATTVRVAPTYGLPHILVWRSDGRLLGWMTTATDMAWSPDGRFVLWMTLDPSGDHRVNIGPWGGH